MLYVNLNNPDRIDREFTPGERVIAFYELFNDNILKNLFLLEPADITFILRHEDSYNPEIAELTGKYETVIIFDEKIISSLNHINDKVKALIIIDSSTSDLYERLIRLSVNSGIKSIILEYSLPSGNNKNILNYKQYIGITEGIIEKFNDLVFYRSNIPECVALHYGNKLTRLPGFSGSSDDIVYEKPVNNCRLCDFFHECPGIPVNENISIIKQLRHLYIKTREAKIELTYNCNMNCEFCFNENSYQDGDDLKTENILKIIDILEKNNFERIRFTGGEPLIRDDIREITSYAKGKGFRIILNTNALLIDHKNEDIIDKYIDDIVISFHNLPNAGTDEEKKYMIIKKFAGRKRVLVDTIATARNIDLFNDYNNLFKALDVIWYYVRPVSNSSGTAVSRGEIINLLKKIHKENNSRLENGIRRKIEITAVPYCIYRPEVVSKISSGSQTCGIGETLTINPSGNVRFCYSIARPDLNIFNSDLSEIMKNNFFTDYKSGKTIPGVCKKCFYLRDCLGGCRFEAYISSKKINAIDPFANPSLVLGY